MYGCSSAKGDIQRSGVAPSYFLSMRVTSFYGLSQRGAAPDGCSEDPTPLPRGAERGIFFFISMRVTSFYGLSQRGPGPASAAGQRLPALGESV